MDWFLYDRALRHEKVKAQIFVKYLCDQFMYPQFRMCVHWEGTKVASFSFNLILFEGWVMAKNEFNQTFPGFLYKL